MERCERRWRKTKELKKRYGAGEGRIVASALERAVSRERLFLFSAQRVRAVGRCGCASLCTRTGLVGAAHAHIIHTPVHSQRLLSPWAKWGCRFFQGLYLLLPEWAELGIRVAQGLEVSECAVGVRVEAEDAIHHHVVGALAMPNQPASLPNHLSPHARRVRGGARPHSVVVHRMPPRTPSPMVPRGAFSHMAEGGAGG